MPDSRIGVYLGAAVAIAIAVAFGTTRWTGVRLPPVFESRPDILLVTVDTLRLDHTSLHGYTRATTPGLEELARRGVRFDFAYAPTATTAPSHASLFTGLSPLAHGVRRNSDRLGADHSTLAEVLRSHGYRTAAFVSSGVLGTAHGFQQGFDLYDDGGIDWSDSTALVPGPFGVVQRRTLGRRGRRTVDGAIAWVREQRAAKAEPIFLWVHLFDPHEPYLPPRSVGDPFGYQRAPSGSLVQARLLYDTEVLVADREMFRLVTTLEAESSATRWLTVITADHGEEFMEHGWRSHGVHLYEESIRVPLLIRWIGSVPEGRACASRTTLQDVMPTLLSLAGIDWIPPTLGDGRDAPGRGIDLTPQFRGGVPAPGDRELYFVRRRYDRPGRVAAIALPELGGVTFGAGIRVRGDQYGLRWRGWKYLEAEAEPVRHELYDLESDPGETNNLAAGHPQLVDRLSAMLAGWIESESRSAPTPAPLGRDRELLEALGYAEPQSEHRE